MTEARLEYYDPLFETITFQKGLPSNLAFLSQAASVDPRYMIRTAEFARLAFLRQAGLAWLIFPSAAHTRFAHAIGCWGLARLAGSLITVKMRESEQPCALSLWLKSIGLREEFYLGLLCHDVGHGPLSNILECNEKFIAGFRTENNVHLNYERRGAALLEGKGELAKAWQQIAYARYGNEAITFKDIVNHLETTDGTVCLPAICYLITRDIEYLDKCSHNHREHLSLVKDVVSGLLVLRQLDHYAQDSYFSGLRQFSINLRGFLSNLNITVLPGDADSARFSVAETGVSYAAGLLFNKRQNLLTAFRSQQILSLHSMVDWALSAYLNSLSDTSSLTEVCTQIAFMEDEQFVETITGIEHAGCRYLGQRIRAVRPYAYIGKWPINQPQTVLTELAGAFGESIEPADDAPPALTFHFQSSLSPPFKEAKGCFNPEVIFIGNTNIALAQHPDYKNNFQHLEEAAKRNYLYLFLRDEERAKEIKSKADSICRS